MLSLRTENLRHPTRANCNIRSGPALWPNAAISRRAAGPRSTRYPLIINLIGAAALIRTTNDLMAATRYGVMMLRHARVASVRGFKVREPVKFRTSRNYAAGMA